MGGYFGNFISRKSPDAPAWTPAARGTIRIEMYGRTDNCNLRCCLFFDDKETVDLYENVLKALAAVALDEAGSREMINSILEGLQ
jgi:hypothetical protein